MIGTICPLVVCLGWDSAGPACLGANECAMPVSADLQNLRRRVGIQLGMTGFPPPHSNQVSGNVRPATGACWRPCDPTDDDHRQDAGLLEALPGAVRGGGWARTLP